VSLVPAHELSDGDTIRSDLCIVGAGAAGIAMANELAGSGLSVALLAGGGETFRHRPQLLYRARNIGRDSFAPGKARLRMLGGSTTRWSAQCRPLDPVDFEARSGVPHTGWPFAREHLEPYYQRAAATCHLSDCSFEPPATDLGKEGVVEPVRYRHGWPTDFGVAYRDTLQAAVNLRLFLDVHALELAENGARILAVAARTEGGQRVRFEAGRYVLACGGIENARLLLVSTASSPHGLGNDRDLVGRYFMDHPFYWAGELDLARPELAAQLEVLEGYESAGRSQPTHGAIALSADARRTRALNGAAMFFVRRAANKHTASYLSAGGTALSRLGEILTHQDLPDGRLGRTLVALGRRPGAAMRTAVERLGNLLRPQLGLGVRVTFENLPDPASRVVLDPGRRDRFGMPRVAVDWRLSERERLGPALLEEAAARALAEAGIGRLDLRAEIAADGHPAALKGGKHHMGTTRMHADPSQGVVGPDCRVHGLDNLFIAGSSVFPTGGYVNPTLTIVALALRLADHLRALHRA
jgi:choline dehydrogenase-like flavoprotein